jgi:protein-S-isoprenylcysteine O-methyltransferase Ste14
MTEPGATARDRRSALLGSALFLVVAPGVVAGLVPALITDWAVDARLPAPLRVLGFAVLVVAAGFLLHAFGRFALEGVGTPAPVAPTRRLVVGGVYRYVRNPMYLAVLGAIAGQALVFGSLGLVAYGGVLAIVFVAFVRVYEEPTLRAEYGEEYDAYRAAVPGWLPRLTPYAERPGSPPIAGNEGRSADDQ